MTSQLVPSAPEVNVPGEVTPSPPEVNPELVPSAPEVTTQPEVPARPEVKKCTLLHNGITGLFIFVLHVVRLGLWYCFGVILISACAWSNIG